MKNKSTKRDRLKGSQNSFHKYFLHPPATSGKGSEFNSELENQLSSTNVDEKNMEESVVDELPRNEDGGKGKKKLSKDICTMALSASNSSMITIVS